MAWQKIETAPKDGTEVDVWADGQRWTNAYFGKTYQGVEAHWYWDAEMMTHEINPTHWMPLPDMPA